MLTSSPQITEVKQRRDRLVLGWVTAVTMPAMCRGVGQAFHITPPLSTQLAQPIWIALVWQLGQSGL